MRQIKGPFFFLNIRLICALTGHFILSDAAVPQFTFSKPVMSFCRQMCKLSCMFIAEVIYRGRIFYIRYTDILGI